MLPMVTTLVRGLLMLSPPMAMDTEVMVDTMVEDTTEERGLLMLMPTLPMAMDTEVMVDTEAMVDTEDTIMVKLFN